MIEHIRQIFFSPTHLVMGEQQEQSCQNSTQQQQHKIAFENQILTAKYLAILTHISAPLKRKTSKISIELCHPFIYRITFFMIISAMFR